MMYGFFNGISRELDEAARIDGCGHLRTFLQVVAPLTLPGLISTTIYAFIQSWNEYMFSMLCITKESMKTLPVAIGQMAGYDKIMWNDLMAASLLSSLPVVILFLFLQKYFINSMMAGAVKGVIRFLRNQQAAKRSKGEKPFPSTPCAFCENSLQ